MRRGNVTTHDLEQALRQQSSQTDPAKVRLAYLERDGSISVVPSEHESRVLSVAVADGVQTVRIRLE
jgi:uncharacterized membrane protein YcaP (DUF421 family)